MLGWALYISIHNPPGRHHSGTIRRYYTLALHYKIAVNATVIMVSEIIMLTT